jgi:hypothetical protein
MPPQENRSALYPGLQLWERVRVVKHVSPGRIPGWKGTSCEALQRASAVTASVSRYLPIRQRAPVGAPAEGRSSEPGFAP